MYRILRKHGKYYPQYKQWLFWNYFKTPLGMDSGWIIHCYDTFQEAKNEIDKSIRSSEKYNEPTKIVWEEGY